MSRIEDLIKQYCPDGAPFYELKEIARIQRGERVTKSQLEKQGDYPVISGGMKPLGYYDYSNRDAGTITIAQYGTAGFIDWQKSKFWANDVCYSIFPNDITNNRYLFYALMNQQDFVYSLKTNAIPAHLPQDQLGKVLIPIPPLPVQEEIVRILDKFTELDAELEAELEARKKQYEFYRNKLITPVEDNGKWIMNGEEVEWKTLGDVGKVCMCKRIMKNETSERGDIPFYKIGTFGKEPDAFISQSTYEKYKMRFSFPKIGEVLISASGTIGRTVIYNGEPAYFQDSNIVWIQNNEKLLTNKFLFHYYKIITWKTEGGTIKRLYNDNLSKTEIPVPSIDYQKRIVSILDKFDSLVNDISIGLPAEIEARRKQYEYYRNRLLSFKRIDS